MRTLERRCVFLPVPNRGAKTSTAIIRRYVHPESTIYTDCWRGYCSLCFYFSSHLTVNHKPAFVDSTTGVHINIIEGTWSAVKAQTPVRKRIRSLVGLYLLRFTIIGNHKERALRKFILLFF